ncbi:MAG: AI-2E family transporter [Rubellimicrobium sp.]|nr:AI-2E family transporter [Rubellimicrobium sp.]
MSLHSQAWVWIGAAVLAALALWWLGDVLLPFALGAALAYVFNPLVRRLGRAGVPRVVAVSGVAILVVLALALLLFLLLPVLFAQLRGLIEDAPELAGRLRDLLALWLPDLPKPPEAIEDRIAAMGEALRAGGSALLQNVLAWVMSAVNIAVMLLLVPVVAFYLLLDWDRMIARIDALLPRGHAPAIRQVMAEIDTALAAFLRGQATVCLILGTFYAVALMLAGLESGLLAGLLAGFVSFIPYLGAVIGGGVALGLALVQFWGDWWHIGLVAVIFVAGQFVEGNILSPRLVGGSVGVHPVWVIFALSFMGALFGFPGLLVAVPVAAVAAVLVRHAVARYRSSAFYLGHEDG